MKRTIECECSSATPGAQWKYGGEYYYVTSVIEYPDELDVLEDDELEVLANEIGGRVRYVDDEQVQP